MRVDDFLCEEAVDFQSDEQIALEWGDHSDSFGVVEEVLQEASTLEIIVCPRLWVF